MLIKGDNHVDASSVCDVVIQDGNVHTDVAYIVGSYIAGMNMSKHPSVQLSSFNFLLLSDVYYFYY